MTAAEMQAKALARKFDALLKFANKRKDLSAEAETRIAKVVSAAIAEVQRIAKDLKKGQRSLQSFIGRAVGAYDMANKIFSWYADFGQTDKAIDMPVTFATSDGLFEPVQIDF